MLASTQKYSFLIWLVYILRNIHLFRIIDCESWCCFPYSVRQFILLHLLRHHSKKKKEEMLSLNCWTPDNGRYAWRQHDINYNNHRSFQCLTTLGMYFDTPVQYTMFLMPGTITVGYFDTKWIVKIREIKKQQ